MTGRIAAVLIAVLVCMTFAAAAQPARTVLFREDFQDLENWRPLTFPKISRHSVYSVVKDGDASYLKTESDASASGIVWKKEFNVSAYPRVRWRWKIDHVYQKGNAEERSGDDYPIRVYILFRYDPETASLGQRIRYGLAKAIYGEYPPLSSLNYIWANRRHAQRIIPNPYASQAKMVILESGSEKAGQWVEESVDILADYREAFGGDPPADASIAVMNDSDNTGERSTSYLDFIEVYR